MLMRCIALGAAIALAAPAGAQTPYPNKTIRIIAPVQPGGGVDLVGRTIADRLGRVLGQSIIVENQSGGGGIVGSLATARAAPDGYTLMVGYVGTHGTNPAVRKVTYDAVRDFTPIAMIGGTPNLLVVHPAVPVADLKGFVDYAKKNPGKLNYGTGGIGLLNHLALEQFRGVAGLEAVYAHYRGIAPTISDLTKGQINELIDHVREVRQDGLDDHHALEPAVAGHRKIERSHAALGEGPKEVVLAELPRVLIRDRVLAPHGERRSAEYHAGSDPTKWGGSPKTPVPPVNVSGVSS